MIHKGYDKMKEKGYSSITWIPPLPWPYTTAAFFTELYIFKEL